MLNLTGFGYKATEGLVKGKRKKDEVRPRTDHENPNGE
jgi:hypothetical protein